MDQTTEAVERVRLELTTRKLMVMMLAVTAVWVGIAIILTGAPRFIEEWFSPWSRYTIGSAAFLAGLTASVGGLMTDKTRRGWWVQLTGLALLVAWYASMGVAYCFLVKDQGLELVGPGEPLDPMSTGRGYVPFIYLGLSLLVLIPLGTMLRLGRPKTPPSQ